MKCLVCELCGSQSFIKTGGVYVCQGCGCVFTPEEARNLLQDIVPNESGSAADIPKESSRSLDLIEEAIALMKSGNWSKASDCIIAISENNRNDYRSKAFSGLCLAAMSGELTGLTSAGQAFEFAKKDLRNQGSDSNELDALCADFSCVLANAFPLALASTAKTLDEARINAANVGLFSRRHAEAEYQRVASNMYGTYLKIVSLLFESVSVITPGSYASESVSRDFESILEVLRKTHQGLQLNTSNDLGEIRSKVLALRCES